MIYQDKRHMTEVYSFGLDEVCYVDEFPPIPILIFDLAMWPRPKQDVYI